MNLSACPPSTALCSSEPAPLTPAPHWKAFQLFPLLSCPPVTDDPQGSKSEALKRESDSITPLSQWIDSAYLAHRTLPGLSLPSSFLPDFVLATQAFFLFLKYSKLLPASEPSRLLLPLPITLALEILRWLAPACHSDLSSKVSSQNGDPQSRLPTLRPVSFT